MTSVQQQLKIMTVDGDSSNSDVEILGEHLVKPMTKEIILDREESEDILKTLNKNFNIPEGSKISQVLRVGKSSSLLRRPTVCKVITVGQNPWPAISRFPRPITCEDILPLSSSSSEDEEDSCVRRVTSWKPVEPTRNSQTFTRKSISNVTYTHFGLKRVSTTKRNVTSHLRPSQGSCPPTQSSTFQLYSSSLKPQPPLILLTESSSLLDQSFIQLPQSSSQKSISSRRQPQSTDTINNTDLLSQVEGSSLISSDTQSSGLYIPEYFSTPKQQSSTSRKHSTPAIQQPDTYTRCFNQELSSIIPASHDGFDKGSNPAIHYAPHARTDTRVPETEKSPDNPLRQTPRPDSSPQTHSCSPTPPDPQAVLNRFTQTSPNKLLDLSLTCEASPRLSTVPSPMPRHSSITVQSSHPGDTALSSSIPAKTCLPSSSLQTDAVDSQPHHYLQWIEDKAGRLFLPLEQVSNLLISPLCPDMLTHCHVAEGVCWEGWTVTGLSLVNVLALLRKFGDKEGGLETLEAEEQLRRLESVNPHEKEKFSGELMSREYFMSNLGLCPSGHVAKMMVELDKKREDMRKRNTRLRSASRRPAAQKGGNVNSKEAKRTRKVKPSK